MKDIEIIIKTGRRARTDDGNVVWDGCKHRVILVTYNDTKSAIAEVLEQTKQELDLLLKK